jgi:hypothetical protein
VGSRTLRPCPKMGVLSCMSKLLNAAMHLIVGSGMQFVYLDDDAMFPDPIVRAKDADTFQAIHLLMCADTGADPTYVSVRRVVDWLNTGRNIRVKAANA